eukprot:tig00021719_g23168.t1
MSVVLYLVSEASTAKVRADCRKVKDTLLMCKVEHEEVNLSYEPARRADMIRLSGKSDLPQVFVNGRYIGGADEIQELLDSGEFNYVFKGPEASS